MLHVMIHNKMEEIYQNLLPENIPWNMDTPPHALLELYDKKEIIPCKTIDLGCGLGNYALYLSGLGFDVTGIDISPTAINIARENAQKKSIKANFLVRDVLGDMGSIKETFDFAFDWELLHHIFPGNRMKYVDNVHKLLHSKGKYLSVCFSDKDPHFGGTGKLRATPLETVLYFSSEDELRKLFESRFKITELKTVKISGKKEPHIANYVFMEKK